MSKTALNTWMSSCKDKINFFIWNWDKNFCSNIRLAHITSPVNLQYCFSFSTWIYFWLTKRHYGIDAFICEFFCAKHGKLCRIIINNFISMAVFCNDPTGVCGPSIKRVIDGRFFYEWATPSDWPRTWSRTTTFSCWKSAFQPKNNKLTSGWWADNLADNIFIIRVITTTWINFGE